MESHQMAEIRLSPGGHLFLEADEPSQERGSLATVRAAFERDWREGLFMLAAERAGAGKSLTVGYWRRIGERYLTGLCHLPGASTDVDVAAPSEADGRGVSLRVAAGADVERAGGVGSAASA